MLSSPCQKSLGTEIKSPGGLRAERTKDVLLKQRRLISAALCPGAEPGLSLVYLTTFLFAPLGGPQGLEGCV